MDTLVTVSTILAVASVTECVLWMVLAIRAVREWADRPGDLVYESVRVLVYSSEA